jgi:hypothetical protein
MDGTASRLSIPSLLDEDSNDGQGLLGMAKTPSPTDIVGSWPASTVLVRYQAFRCSIWLEMSEPVVMVRVSST